MSNSSSTSSKSVSDSGPSDETVETGQISSRKQVQLSIKFLDDDIDNFALSDLKQFPYFDAMFCDRWLENRKEDDIIDIFGESNNNANIPKFGSHDLKLLLACNELGHIPFDAHLNGSQINSLLNCYTYLTAGHANDKNINMFGLNKHKIIEYFQNCIPSIDAKTRKEWLLAATHATFKEACIEYDNLLQKQLSMAQQLCASNSMNPSVSLAIKYDSDTAALMFKQKYKFIVAKKSATELRLLITNYKKEEFEHLLNLFDINGYWHYFGSDVSYLVKHFENLEYALVSDYNVYKSVRNMLSKTRNHISQESRDSNIAWNVTKGSLLKSTWNMLHMWRPQEEPEMVYKANSLLSFSYMTASLTKQENQTWLPFVLSTYDSYHAETRPSSDDSPQRSIDKQARIASWWQLVQSILDNCTPVFVANNAKDWFPLMHESEDLDIDETAEWLSKNILAKLNTQLAFNFSLYLIDYAVYHHKGEKSTFPAKYLEFVKRKAGIEWDITAR